MLMDDLASGVRVAHLQDTFCLSHINCALSLLARHSIYLVKNKEWIPAHHHFLAFSFFPITNKATFIGWRRNQCGGYVCVCGGGTGCIKVLTDLSFIPSPHFLPQRLMWWHTSVIPTILWQDRKQRQGESLGCFKSQVFSLTEWSLKPRKPLTTFTTTPSFLRAE